MFERMYGSSWFRFAIFGFALLICFLPIIFYKNDDFMNKFSIFFISGSDDEALFYNDSRYLVASAKCKIPNIKPFNSQVKKFMYPEEYYPCRAQKLLTYVTKIIDSIATLHIDAEIVPSYTKNNISCCYSYITRKENKRAPDDHIEISRCIPFKDKVILQKDFVHVKCGDTKTHYTIYENTHAAITVNKQVRKKMEMATINTTNNPFSVLLVGIDSISRLNLMRSLPKTYQFLEANEWVSLKGYNKIAYNTYPNVMAILTGYNSSYAFTQCDPKKLNKLDHCPIIWYDFGKLSYVTGFAEDVSRVNTFNYVKKGFTRPPTDYYFRPYIIGTETLRKISLKSPFNYCTGPESAGERIMNIAKDFAITFKDYPSFGFFWMNSFSHGESISSPTRMDEKVKAFLEDITKSGVLENTIVIFLSDHGLRFGRFRYTPVSWLEERLPFIYISLPERFEKEFPNETRNLKRNRHKLTTPYDLHMTLQHILTLSGFNYTIKSSSGCPLCKSLFSEIEKDRSCEDAGIEPQWCTCAGYTQIDQNNKTAIEAAHYIIGKIHKTIHDKKRDLRCAKYSLHKIITASISETFTYKRDVYLLLLFETSPKATFEGTVSYEKNADGNNFQLKGGIYRVDSYRAHSKCERDSYMKEYCYCTDAGFSTLLNQNIVINLHLSIVIYFLLNALS